MIGLIFVGSCVEALVEVNKENSTNNRKKIEELINWINIVFHYFASYIQVAEQRTETKFLLNVVQ